MKIKVQNLCGKRVTYDVDEEQTLEQFKIKLLGKDVDPKIIKLIFKGKRLDESLKFSESNLTSEDTIYLLISFLGG